MITTEAWVLHRGPHLPGDLLLEEFELPEPGPHDVLVEPVYGSWEANLSHAIARSPVDICQQRREQRIVLGNAGIVRVLRPGPAVAGLAEGDLCFLVCGGVTDEFGYVKLVHAYDAPGTVGVLARRLILPERVLQRVPADDRYDLLQWAPYARYWTAWDNWQVAHNCWRSQMDGRDIKQPLAFAWGGGVGLAELELALRNGFTAVMTASTPDRLAKIRERGIIALDRREFPDLHYDAARMRTDSDFRSRYLASERTFLDAIRELSDGYGASIVIDNIGEPVSRASVRALGRQAVFATVGWKGGMRQETLRAVECINRHIYVHTHACRVGDVPRIVEYQRATGFLPDMTGEQVYDWTAIPDLARDYAEGRTKGFFPTFAVAGAAVRPADGGRTA